MRIKSLQVHGFKSFVDKVVFSFDDGVTAVVGPNGCGKSNVVDAVRWVMGEQSAKRLRGKGMDDVIFAGSETRPPIGMAEVVLTFDNASGTAPGIYSEYPEIQITRRLYRSGESEYLLNKTPCRLRDVHDFFRDTGIGVRGYTIVEQGRIAEIVSAKAEDRRLLIEEAAGISKYKARRRQAESKIASTETNLNRVSDVLAEIKRQISSLERQARKAARFKRLRETQRVLELSIASEEMRELKAAAEEASATLSVLHDQVTGLETNISERELAVESQRIALAESEKAATQGAEALFALRSEIKQIEGQIEFNRREVESLDESNSGRREEIEQLREQMLTARAEAQQAEDELEQLQESLSSEVETIEAAENEVRDAQEAMRAIERERDAANEAFVSILTGLARSEDRASAIEDRGAEIDQRMRSADRELEVHQGEALEAGREESHLEEGLRNLLTDLDRFQRELRTTISAHEAASHALKQAAAARDAQREKFEARRARLASLEEVIERREDVGDATRHLMEGAEASVTGGAAANESFGMRGLVRDMLEVDRSAERAVEAVLAERAEAIVVDSAPGAVKAVAKLRHDDAGRGVFVVEPRSMAPSIGLVPLGQPLMQFVRPRAGAEGVARALLGDVYLIESLERALAVYGDGGIPATFVTSDGDVLSPDGVIRGGGESAGSGMLGRVREVRELRQEVAALALDFERREQSFREAETILERTAEELENLRNRHHTTALAVANHEKDLDRTRERVKAMGEAQDGRVCERSELLSESESLVEETQRIATQIEEMRGQRDTKQRALDSLGLNISSAGREVSRLETRVTELRVAHRNRVETGNRLEEILARSQNAVSETSEWVDRREREIAAAGDRKQRLQEESQASEQRLAQSLVSEEELRLANESQRAAYEERSAALGQLEDEVRGLRGELESRREETANADLVVRESSLRLDHQSESIRERWQVDIASWTPPSLEDLESQVASNEASATSGVAGTEAEAIAGHEAEAAPETDASSPASALRELRQNAELAQLPIEERRVHLEKLRAQIQSLGDVNLGAIEEHEELAERFRFLSEQKEDLDNTIQSLREAIARINRTSRKRFRETFEQVSKCFAENFPRLFGGGKASLSLTESEDVLDAGVDIMAMPPGKRNQNVNLLSGGEKTMTALALLMAVFQVRPSPFFLLDEVDAALDDANVGRFNSLITELAQQSQFLVITHNKRTIEVADVLYGVTMEQRGVSKLVAVALD